jgi:EmrB/QacA subfamily drug resistance transporter
MDPNLPPPPGALPQVGDRPRWRVEPARPAWLRNHPRAYWFAVATVCVGAFMGQLDASIVTLALPDLQRTFHSSLGAVTWVGLGYLVTLVGLVTAVGRLADTVGRKLLYTYGFLVFIAGSALCAVAPSLGSLVGFRVLQAIGAAMLQANSVAIVYLVMPPERLGRGLGVQGAAQALGLALGPTVGGFLIALGGWRWIFWVNVPFGFIGAGLGWVFLPRSRDLGPGSAFDWWGAGLLASAVAAVLWVVSFGNSYGWTSPRIIAGIGVGTLLLVGLTVREGRFSNPLVPPALLRPSRLSAGLASGLLAYLVMFGTLLLVPFFLERGLGLGSGLTGLVLTAMPAGLALVAPLAGRWADHAGAGVVTVAGMLVTSGSLAALALAARSPATVTAALAAEGVGLGLFTPANNAAIMASASRSEAGLVGGLLNMTRGVGTALGLAVTGLVLALAGGSYGRGRSLAHGFTVSGIFLAALALGAAVVASLRLSAGPGGAGTAMSTSHYHEGLEGADPDGVDSAG